MSRSQVGLPTPAAIAQAQLILSGMGVYRGPVNGIMNGPTRAAIRAFQEASRLPVTGELDQDSALFLGVSPTVASPGQQVLVVGGDELAGQTFTPVVSPLSPDQVRDFQTSVGLPATGRGDAATRQALETGFVTVPPNIPTADLPDQIPTVELP